MAGACWLAARVLEPDALPIALPKRKVPLGYMLLRVWLTCVLLAFAGVGVFATTQDHSVGDALLGFILFTLALLYFYASSPDAGEIELDRDGFTYRQLFSVKHVLWCDVIHVASARAPRNVLGLVLVTLKNQKRPLSISGYFDVSGEDLALAMTRLASQRSSEQL